LIHDFDALDGPLIDLLEVTATTGPAEELEDADFQHVK
jgi:hypothetical protein